MMNSNASLQVRAAAELELRRRRKHTRPDYRAQLKILDNQTLELIPFVWNKAQADYAENRTGRDLLLKARQLGFSTFIQAENFAEAIERTTLSATLAHDDATTQKVYDNLDVP